MPEAVAEGTADAASPAAPAHRPPWPAALPAQIRLLADTLAASATPLSRPAVGRALQGKGRWRERLPTLLDTLAAWRAAAGPRPLGRAALSLGHGTRSPGKHANHSCWRLLLLARQRHFLL